MASKYDKNFTDQGYLMNYKKGVGVSPFKNRVLQFKIEMPQIMPLIWRRIQVPWDYNFWDLHVAIQDSMGWQDYHLHHFEIKGRSKKTVQHIGIPDFDRLGELQEVLPGWEIPVTNYFNDLGITAKYLYDYGDSWWHTVQLEGYMHRQKKVVYPVCLGGERACPPEDCGGTHGYYQMLSTLSDPANDDYEDIQTWVGKDWDPEAFSVEKIHFCNPHKRWRKAFLEDKGV